MSAQGISPTRVVGVGAGGHARVVIDILRLMGGFDLVGLVDRNPELAGTLVDGVPVIGDDDQLAGLRGRGIDHGFVGVGSTGSSRVRRRIYTNLRELAYQVVTAVHPAAVVAESAVLGAGSAVMAAAVVNPGARIGENVIVNTGAIIEHDCVIESHAHIATGARLSGGVQVGVGSHVGVGASVRQGIAIGCNSTVGAGAAVVDDVPDNVVVAGVPARLLRKVEA